MPLKKGEKMSENNTNKGNYWCHIRRDFFKWEDAYAFWSTHDWKGNPIVANTPQEA
jgi:hypothetical protein|tara:strand:+ start:469 stop:636 length:168 start_codon:yes stop_codon:yes gene_type:complete